ncbi:alpha-amylase family protein [Nakamurella endophytica]|uniref:Trehalose synthase n=1 Tax=Nakamurella endophytica TaxID=1748367 RepID=A0A917T427_9ACTN|nr:alpha-amylase family protein [Nakamurella endophytica]GGM07633.1 trehalose synthase [Nakamurella endophytica]
MSERWYKEAVVYSLQVDSFADSDGDGCGDLRGLISRLDYLARLGVTCLWLNPVHPSPLRDNGYDITDYYGIHPRLGSLGDFAELVLEARERGMRILMDLVVNHTSDEHPWFVSAQGSPDSPYRDWYVWSDTEPSDRKQGMVFPGEQEETWSWSDAAQSWYYHRFYGFQPDLNWANPAVRAEIRKVMGFWLQLGVAGFRVDAAPFILEQTVPGVASPPMDWTILDDWRSEVQWRRGDAVLLCEANVGAVDVPKYTGENPEGANDRAHMMFSFGLNARLWLALARGLAEPVVEALQSLPRLQAMAQWATFLRNHDELDLSKLTADQRAEVFAAFGPKADMRIYDRGIRRRLAPMLRGDRRHVELAYALQFSMPGSPVLRYGEELGMGEDLSLDGRESIRTPMQWDDGPNAGFSDAADPGDLVRPVVTRGPFSYRTVNVRAEQRDRDSLLRWFGELIDTVRECPEIGVGVCSVLDVPTPPSVLAHRFDAPEGSILLLHNLADGAVTVDIGRLPGTEGRPWEMFADGPYPRPAATLRNLSLNGWGYRWIRLRRGRSD